ncbi:MULTISPECIES: YajG family lipoprotein [unclassified Lonepinella]|uniref:YajG family lipoprotein n=1 Tax=unclassified Lonepinella TaxID=2642006 RepID=UPI0036DFA133
MKLSKTISLATLVASAILLVGCSNTPSNTLSFNPQSPTATTAFNAQNQKAIVNVVSKDGRSQPEISSYTMNSALFKLYSSPAVEKLFQQVIQQDLNAKGFRLADSGVNTNVLVTVKDFYAKVEEGNIRHKITSKVQLEVHVQGFKGNFTKNFGASRVDEGALGVNNDDIQKSLDATLKDVVSALYKDTEIAGAISRYVN